MLKPRINLLHPVVARELAQSYMQDAHRAELSPRERGLCKRRANKHIVNGNMAAIALALDLGDAQRVYVNPNH